MKPVSAAALAANSLAQRQASHAAVALRATRERARQRVEKARADLHGLTKACGLNEHQARCVTAAAQSLAKAAAHAATVGSDVSEPEPAQSVDASAQLPPKGISGVGNA